MRALRCGRRPTADGAGGGFASITSSIYQHKMAARHGIAARRPRSRRPPGWNAGRRLRVWRRCPTRPAARPLLLLLLGLSTLFLYGGDREYFYRHGHHDNDSARTLAIAENLSFRQNLLLYSYQSRDADGNLHYPEVAAYNRFPVGMYGLVKLAILPFDDGAFRAKIYAARLLMLLLFCGAAVLAYLALARIAGSRWDAATATLLAFSAYYLLYYSDMIFSGATIDLFGVMLAFHGMVVFVQDRRWGQLLIKSCLALLLGWHVYAFLLPFIVFGSAAELLRARRTDPASAPALLLGSFRRYGAVLLRSRYLLLGVVTLLFGIAALGFNFGNEYRALDGAVALRELPSVRSMVKRFGGLEAYNARYAEQLAPGAFVQEQFYRIAVMSLPAALNPYAIKSDYAKYGDGDYPAIALGMAMVGLCLAGLAGVRRRPGALLLLGTLICAGFCWAVLVSRSAVTNDFEVVFYIGIPLTFFTLALMYLRRIAPARLAPALALAALGVFIISAAAMSGVGADRALLAVEAEQMDDYARVRKQVADDATLYVQYHMFEVANGGAAWAWAFFLAGKTYITPEQPPPYKPQQPGDYLLLTTREDNPALLTPDNRHLFLYDWARYAEWFRSVDRGDPIIAADAGGWQVYLSDGHLTYVASECAHPDEPFFLHFTPRNLADLPAVRQEYGFDNRDFTFRFGGIHIDDACVIARPLPDYDLAAIRTGQYNADGRIWQGEYRLPAP